MATPEDVSTLREMIHEPNSTPYSNDYLSGVIESTSSLVKAAEIMWTRKAARFADLVDVREGASARSLGDLHKQALLMAKTYGDQSDEATGGDRPTSVRPIARRA